MSDDKLPELVADAIATAKDRWGDVPVTAETLHHEDGTTSITVFHTIYSDARRVGRVELLWNEHYQQEHFVVELPNKTARVEFHDFDGSIERLRSADYWRDTPSGEYDGGEKDSVEGVRETVTASGWVFDALLRAADDIVADGDDWPVSRRRDLHGAIDIVSAKRDGPTRSTGE